MPTTLTPLTMIKQQVQHKFIPVAKFAHVPAVLTAVCHGPVPGGYNFLLTYVYPGFTELHFGTCLANNKRKVSDVVTLISAWGKGYYTSFNKKPPLPWQMAVYEEILWRTCWVLVMVP
jgi:hypothetical protein